jgi:hypothetical protein
MTLFNKYWKMKIVLNFTLIQKYSINLEPLPIEAASIGTEERCNNTNAGLGYLELLEMSKQILLLEQLASVRTVNS